MWLRSLPWIGHGSGGAAVVAVNEPDRVSEAIVVRAGFTRSPTPSREVSLLIDRFGDDGARPRRRFEVMKPFPVAARTVAAAFDRSGLGMPLRSNVELGVLLRRGILREIP
jgi:pimeloyl-ACP methyl ester carboxylesterase